MSTLGKIINEHIEWRGQILLLAKADIIKTYSGAALGWAWAIVKPVMTILVFWWAFTYGLRSSASVNGYAFALWMIPGFMAWFYMSDMLNKGAAAVRKYKFLVTKMKFPVSTIPTFTAIANIVIHVFLMVIVCIIFVLTGHFPDLYWLQTFFYMALMLLFWTGWALFASMLGAMSKDFINLVKSIGTVIFWTSGIMWDVNTIDIPWLQNVL